MYTYVEQFRNFSERAAVMQLLGVLRRLACVSRRGPHRSESVAHSVCAARILEITVPGEYNVPRALNASNGALRLARGRTYACGAH